MQYGPPVWPSWMQTIAAVTERKRRKLHFKTTQPIPKRSTKGQAKCKIYTSTLKTTFSCLLTNCGPAAVRQIKKMCCDKHVFSGSTGTLQEKWNPHQQKTIVSALFDIPCNWRWARNSWKTQGSLGSANLHASNTDRDWELLLAMKVFAPC